MLRIICSSRSQSLLSLLALWVLLGATAFGQATAARPDRGAMTGASYAVSDIENISLTNGNLNLTIPLASLPPIAGGKLKLTLNAVYNSKLWNMTRVQGQLGTFLGCPSWVVSTPQLSDLGGWTISGAYRIVVRDAHEDFDYAVPDPPPTPSCEGDIAEQARLQNRWYRTILITPDGAEHELRPVDYNASAYNGTHDYLRGYYKDTPETVHTGMRYYSFDGTFMWAVLNPAGSSTYWTVYLNDGTKVAQLSSGIQRISDTNGNSIKIYSDANGTHYQDEQTQREIRAGSDNKIWYQTVGGTWESVDLVMGTTQVQGKVYSVEAWSPTGGETGGGFVCHHNELLQTQITVLRQIVFPATESGIPGKKFLFSYNSDSTSTATDDVVWACGQAPQSYTRTVSYGMGALSQMTMPSGAVASYTYSRDGTNKFLIDSDDIPRETITQKQLTHDGITETWGYEVYEFGSCGGKVTGPDGSVTTESCYEHDPAWGMFFGHDSIGKAGLVFRSNRDGKERIDRHWTLLTFSNANTLATGATGLATFNPVVDVEYTSLLDASGNPLKMSAKKYDYDYNGNRLSETDYDWFDPALVTRDSAGVPTAVPASATVLGVSSSTYYNPAPAANSANVYAVRSLATATPLILNALKQSTTGTRITQLSYDDQAYETAPAVGNLTSQSVWDDVDAKWITTSQTYGPYGNIATRTDPRGNVTRFFFDDATYALPTRVVVDPLNGTGQQTTTTAFDFYTGVVTSVTDANGNTSTIDYTNQRLGAVDPFGRPGVSLGPLVNAGGINQHSKVVTTHFDNQRQVVVATSLFGENDTLLKTRVTADMLGRTVLTEQTEDGTNYSIFSLQAYDPVNRISYSSSPMKGTPAQPVASSTDSWTRTTTDSLGKVTEIATFGGATKPPATGDVSVPQYTGRVARVYDANTVTATDQAGRQTKRFNDALGRVTIVIEDSTQNGLNYQTTYDYDAFGNLAHVYQGSQTRTFNYDSLSRLRSALNPESGTISYAYDDNGNLSTKSDARPITTTYTYDGLNRPLTRSYSDGTPAVTYVYDTLANGKGRVTSVSSSVSSYAFSGYDSMGRVNGASQTVGAQSYSLSYAYDLASHVTATTYPSGHTVTNAYDNAGRLQNLTGTLGDGASRTYATGFVYGADGQMTQEQLGTTSAVFNKRFYNSRGQLAEIREGTTGNNTNFELGAIINFYDTCWGMCAGQSMPINNGSLRRQEVYIPGGPMFPQDYDYDSLNRLQDIHDGTNWRQQYIYDRYGNRTVDQANTFGSGIPKPNFTVSTVNNRLGVPSGQTGTITFDGAGNLTVDTYSGAAVSRAYDAENRLTSETTYNSVVSGAYTYDGDGRRVKRKANGVETWQVYGAGGELLAEYAQNGSPASPQKEYGYRNGQLLVVATATTGWGTPPVIHDNPLVVSVTTVQSRHITELRTAIDALRSHLGMSAYSWQQAAAPGDLIKAEPVLEMRTALDQVLGAPGSGYSAGLAQGQAVKAIHVQELRDRVLGAWIASGSTDFSWLVSDQLGTPRMIFDQTGALANVKRHDYLPFGEELFAGTAGRTTQVGYVVDSVRQKFTQKERDLETGLDYFLARYYSSTQGRFTSPDPLYASGRPVAPQSWNRYSYVLNKPLSLTDPNGLIWGTQDFEQDGHKYRRYHWFNGNKVGKGFTAFIPDKDGTVIPLRGGGGARIYRNGGQETWPGPAGDGHFNNDSLNLAAGHAHGIAKALTGGSPIGGALVDSAFNQIGGVDRDSALYTKGDAIGDGVVSGVLSLAGAGLAEAEGTVAATEETVANEGIYEFTASSGKTYVGQSGNISRRIGEHLASGKLLEADIATVRTTGVTGGKTAREIAEQLRINELGGIKNLENARNPIGKARSFLLGEH
jgi:RHS repeat-associated protein